MAQISLATQVPEVFWESRLVTNELLKAAHEDPSLWPAQATRIANYDVNLRNGALAWQESAQIAMRYVGPVSGFPTSVLPVVVGNVGEMLLEIPNDTRMLAIKMAQIGVGVAMAATAAIPIVGAVVNAIGAVAQYFLALAAKPRDEVAVILPPLAEYTEETDQWVVNNQVLPVLSTFDWTGLFLPRHRGEWKAYGREGKGIEAHGVVGGNGLGFMPGTQRVSSVIQVFWLRRGHLAEASPELAASHNDVGSFYPGAAQITTAMQEQVAKVQTQMYNVNTTRIESAWEEYVGAAFELAKGIYERKPWAVQGTPLAQQTLAQNRVFAQHMVAPLIIGPSGDIDVLATGWTPEQGVPEGTVLRIIKRWCKRVRTRQWNNLGRITGAAYTLPTQAAFDNQQMMAKLMMMRQALLEHPARRSVVMDDVIDPAFKADLFDTTIGDTLAAGPSKPQVAIDPDVPKDPPPPDVGGGVPFGQPPGEGGLGKVLLAGGAALALGYIARKRKWI
jgi:hypothetical protein